MLCIHNILCIHIHSIHSIYSIYTEIAALLWASRCYFLKKIKKKVIKLSCCGDVLALLLYMLCMCPHTTIYVSTYYYICVLILRYVFSYYYMCPHARRVRGESRRSYYYTHTTIYVSSYYYICVLILGGSGVSHDDRTTILILLYMCPHTTIYVSSY